ncbi:MAG: putative Actinobacterial Holin-X, holin superfamily, partial [Myxococcales bacterium]|nr:putative Actinobacterial Holin-X, holin superfamily [Myxococcales bacterium]
VSRMNSGLNSEDVELGDEPALPSLVKNVVDGLGTLVAGHVKLARTEIEASAKSFGRHLGLFVVAGAFALLGYAFGCVAGALALASVIGVPLAFLAVGGAHVLGAGVVIGVLWRRAVPSPLGETLSELDQTVSLLATDARVVRRALEAPVASPPASNGHARERIAARGA